MLKTQLTHPEILGALGRLGHGSKVLIADGNFPFATYTNPAAAHVYLNLRPGLVAVTDVLEALISGIVVEAAQVMQPADGSTPDIFHEFGALLPGLTLERVRALRFLRSGTPAGSRFGDRNGRSTYLCEYHADDWRSHVGAVGRYFGRAAQGSTRG